MGVEGRGKVRWEGRDETGRGPRGEVWGPSCGAEEHGTYVH